MPDGDYDSQPLLTALHHRGLGADIRAWNDPSVDWTDAAVTVIRSTWDYHTDLTRFLDWVARVDAVTALFNPPGLIRWNTDKRYLLDLERDGIAIVPTLVASATDAAGLERAITANGWSDIVIKPAVSLDGQHVHRVSANRGVDAILDSLAFAGTVIAQPFMNRIITSGELSLAFIGGRFSHAVRKRPARGEFRVQERLGGTVEGVLAPSGSIAFAARVLELVHGPPLYARIDIIEGDDESPFLLTELELVEPSLFLATHGPAAATFAAAIGEHLPR
jgi:glutathione synthase/RimK-type ligase-like ATP-grasp enzyme